MNQVCEETKDYFVMIQDGRVFGAGESVEFAMDEAQRYQFDRFKDFEVYRCDEQFIHHIDELGGAGNFYVHQDKVYINEEHYLSMNS